MSGLSDGSLAGRFANRLGSRGLISAPTQAPSAERKRLDPRLQLPKHGQELVAFLELVCVLELGAAGFTAAPQILLL